MKRSISVVASMLLCAAAVSASERRYPFKQIELKNGLKVISLEDFSCPVATVQVWYHVGSKDENPERQGFAHMFEHMMFRGTDRLGPTDHFDNIRRVGGNTNAYTTFDQTVYLENLPSNQLELALWLEAERMAFLKIDQESFTTERKVVEEERRLGLNSPYGTVPEKLLAELYHKHPYRWSTIGKIAHLEDATIDELQAFWDRFYVPNNATLVVVGAVKHADVQQLAQKYFSWIPRCPQPPRITVQEPEQTKSRSVKLKEDKGPLPIVGVLYHTVPMDHPDAIPLEILMGVLGGGESSRLYVDLVKDQKIAQMALAGAFGLEQDGLAGAGGILLPFGNKKKLLQTVKRHIQRITDEPITKAEMEKEKNQLLRNEVAGALTVSSKAGLLGRYAVLYGDAEQVNRRLAAIDAVTIEDVQRVAKTYLKKSRRTSVLVEPSIGGIFKSLLGGDKDAQTEETPVAKATENRVATRTGPKAEAKRPKDFPDAPPVASLLAEFPEVPHTDRTLPNGLRVVVVGNHEVPMVTFRLGIRSGAWTEDKPGAASFAMSMLTTGTKTHDAKELAELLESNAVNLSGFAGMDTAGVSGSALVPKLELAMGLAADVIQNPTFPKDEFDIMKKQITMGLMISTKTPQYLAQREFRQRVYGHHPYARTPTGELDDVEAIAVDDLKQWWSEHVRPENAVMYFAGDITPSEAFKLAEKHLGKWKVNGAFSPPPAPQAPERQPTHIYLVNRPGSVQSQIRVGHLGVTRKDSRYFVSRVLSSIFGGGFNSRLNKAIRVDKGLTYGAGGGFSPRRFSGEFQISTFTKTPTTAETLRVILDEIHKIQTGPPTPKELTDTKTYISGAFPGQRETPEATVGDLWMIETQGLPEDYLHRYLRGITHATAEDVAEAAKAMIDADQLTIVVVGEADKIRAGLEEIAPVTVVGQSAPADDEPAPSS